MESNELYEKLQNDKGSNPKNKNNPDCNETVVKTLQKQQEGNTTSISGKTTNSVVRLTQRTKKISDKLATKSQQLQLHKTNVERNKDRIKENDTKVVKALQSISKKAVFTKEKTHTACAEVHLPNEDVLKPLSNHSRKELQNLVEGLQELVCKLTVNDRNLKSKAKNIAHNIRGLRHFPIFSNEQKGTSTSGSRGQTRDSDYYHEENQSNSKRDLENGAFGRERENLKKMENKRKTPSQAEMFANYINFMLAEYLGEQQPDKLALYRCLPTHIEDLESFAKTLVQAGFGRIVEAEIRINRKNNRQAFILMSADRETSEKDGMIFSLVARRYAFEGDIVRAFVLNEVNANSSSEKAEGIVLNRKIRKISSHSTADNNSISLAEEAELFDYAEDDSLPESDTEEINILDNTMAVVTEYCRKAFVIRIVKQTELREVLGSISFMNTTAMNSKLYYKLNPHDVRVPMVYINKELCVEEIKAAGKDVICGMLYVARILETDNNGHCIGELVQPVGKVGDLQAEVKAILLHNGLKDIQPYERKFHEMYEGPMSTISDKELEYREDLRKKCIFTIDPITAKDLDDAVSVEKLDDVEYEIGVHISDVSYYLEENSELDNLVMHRTTSIYLVNEVIHMLPSSLCFRCSLLPGEDKFAFSVFWKWNTEKEVLSKPRFTRSIINSCSQLAYEHAQKIIDNPMEEYNRDDLPDLLNEWSPNDVKWRVLLLHQIAQKLKAKRYEDGALSINNPKLRFEFDPKTGEPIAYKTEDRQEANFLIEEFMLLANQSVAKFIHDYFPDTCILRSHEPPLSKYLKALKERLNNMGLKFDISSSKTIYESMQCLSQEASDPKAVEACLNALLTKSLARARYFCSEGKTEADFCHYALSIPIYTHFTSPIRRYPDILVHRLLAAALNYCPPPQRTPDELHHLAKICNDQKLNAKNAGDESIELFFKRYLKAQQLIRLKAVVTDISKLMLNVVTIETGHTIPITYKSQKVVVDATNAPSSITIAEKNSILLPIKLQLFSTVDIDITLQNEKICGFFSTFVVKRKREKSSKSAELSNKNNFSANDVKIRHENNSISEQEDDNTPTSSKAKTKLKSVNNKKENERVYAISNDE